MYMCACIIRQAHKSTNQSTLSPSSHTLLSACNKRVWCERLMPPLKLHLPRQPLPYQSPTAWRHIHGIGSASFTAGSNQKHSAERQDHDLTRPLVGSLSPSLPPSLLPSSLPPSLPPSSFLPSFFSPLPSQDERQGEGAVSRGCRDHTAHLPACLRAVVRDDWGRGEWERVRSWGRGGGEERGRERWVSYKNSVSLLHSMCGHAEPWALLDTAH